MGQLAKTRPKQRMGPWPIMGRTRRKWMVLSTNQRLETQTGIKDKTQNKSCTLRSISRQREALYLYRVKLRSTGPRLDYSSEGGLISLPDRLHLERQYADETVRIQHSTLARRKLTFFYFYFNILFLFYFYFLFWGVIWHIVSLELGWDKITLIFFRISRLLGLS